MNNTTATDPAPAGMNGRGKRSMEGRKDLVVRKRVRPSDHTAAITTREADPSTALDVDILILDHLAYQATQACLASRSKTTNIISPGRKLAAFDSFHAIFHARHPQYKPDDELRFRILLLKLVVLYTQRFTSNSSTPSLEALQTLRRRNRERAARWSGNNTFSPPRDNIQVSRNRIPETPRKHRETSTGSSASFTMFKRTPVQGTPSPTKPTPGPQIFTWEEDNALLDGIRLKLSVPQTLARYEAVLNRALSSCRARRRYLLQKYGGTENVETTLAELPREEESENEDMEDRPSQHVQSEGALPENVKVTTPLPGGSDFYCLASNAQTLNLDELEANRALVLETLEAPAEIEDERPFYGTPASVALLDVLPLFMEVSAARTALSDADLTDTWMHLAGEFMMWAGFEGSVVRGLGCGEVRRGADVVDVWREAFFWGYNDILPQDRSEEEILAMFTIHGMPDVDARVGELTEDPTWTATKRDYLSFLLPKAPFEKTTLPGPVTASSRKMPWTTTHASSAPPPTATELLARLSRVWEQYDLQVFELKMIQFLTALAGSLELPILTQLETGKLDGMSEEETQGFLKDVCGIQQGWNLPKKLRVWES